MNSNPDPAHSRTGTSTIDLTRTSGPDFNRFSHTQHSLTLGISDSEGEDVTHRGEILRGHTVSGPWAWAINCQLIVARAAGADEYLSLRSGSQVYEIGAGKEFG